MITLLYASFLSLLLLWLSYKVVQQRQRHQVGIGTGSVAELERAVRVHANFCEYVPLALLLLLLIESALVLPAWALHALGLVLVLGRLLHARGLAMSAGASSARVAGTVMTWLVLLVGALLGLGLALSVLFSA
ncbi:MAG: MAPEG family protein [Wenzhouxiangellaceae bacterium]|nr:MAPEG family protein [Wenzhouxiangellaceae bacterium]